MPVLLVAAVEAELGPLHGHALGVGPLRAAVAMGSLLHHSRPSRVVMVGSCGVYGTRFPIGTAVVGSTLGWAETGAVAGHAYVPLPPAPLEAAPWQGTPNLPHARVLTVGAITTDAAVAQLHGTHWDVEHMEAYGAALACAAVGVPFSVVLGVANQVGPHAHAQWKAHREEAEAAARAVVVQAGRWVGQILPAGTGEPG